MKVSETFNKNAKTSVNGMQGQHEYNNNINYTKGGLSKCFKKENKNKKNTDIKMKFID